MMTGAGLAAASSLVRCLGSGSVALPACSEQHVRLEARVRTWLAGVYRRRWLGPARINAHGSTLLIGEKHVERCVGVAHLLFDQLQRRSVAKVAGVRAHVQD